MLPAAGFLRELVHISAHCCSSAYSGEAIPSLLHKDVSLYPAVSSISPPASWEALAEVQGVPEVGVSPWSFPFHREGAGGRSHLCPPDKAYTAVVNVPDPQGLHRTVTSWGRRARTRLRPQHSAQPMAAWSWGLNPGTQLDSTPTPPGPVLAQRRAVPSTLQWETWPAQAWITPRRWTGSQRSDETHGGKGHDGRQAWDPVLAS